MAMLIPDARRSLLGGIVDDATLLGTAAPDIDQAVDAYRTLRAGPNGWMVGRLVVPASRLEDLAGVLVRTMRGGDAAIPIVVAADGHAASDASIASAFQATMDPAARIDVIRLAAGAVVEDANATRGIHHDVLPLVTLSPNAAAAPLLAAMGEAKEVTLHSVGLAIDAPLDVPGLSSLAASIRACTQTSTPFIVHATRFSASTQIDPAKGRVLLGVMNLLAAVLQVEATVAETLSTLSDTEPATHTIGFAGLSIRGESLRAARAIGSDRSPLLSLSALEPATTVEAIGALNLSA